MAQNLSPAAKVELERLQAPVSEGDAYEVELDFDAERANWSSDHADQGQEGVKRAKEADRRYAMTLASIRHAFGLTQSELAKQMRTTQGRISTIESGGDMLLSTLLGYLHAAGLCGHWTFTTESGQEIDIDLDAILASGSR